MSKLTAANAQPFMLSERSALQMTDPEFGSSGHVCLTVEVQGYWSDVISLYARRDWRYERPATGGESEATFRWNFNLSHSSGGRTTDEVADDADAETNFAAALTWAAGLLRSLRANAPTLEAAYQRSAAAGRAAEAAEKAAKQALIDADPALGERAARCLFDLAAATRKAAGHQWNSNLNVNIRVFPRGAESARLMEFWLSRNDAVQVNWGSSRITRADALKLLAESSARTALSPATAAA